MAKTHISDGDPKEHTLGEHGTGSESLERVDGAEMTFADENSVVCQLFSALRALMNFIDMLNAAVNAVKANRIATIVRRGRIS